MGAAVLADIKLGEMKAEDIEDAQHRPDRFPDEALAPDLGKVFLEDGKIRGDFLGTAVAHARFSNPCAIGRSDLEGETTLDKENKLPPWLAGVTGNDLIAKQSEVRAQYGNSLQE